MDTLTPEQRSERMGRVRARDTGPEWRVRRLVHGMGLRYRLHDRSLPGRPDLVFAGRRLALFVHGCFWHRHEGCPLARMPKSNVEFWEAKLEGNRMRDLRNLSDLAEMGWSGAVIWECQTERPDSLRAAVCAALGL